MTTPVNISSRVHVAELLPTSASSSSGSTPTDYARIEPRQTRHRASSSASWTRATKFFGLSRTGSDQRTTGRSRSGSELSISSSSWLSSLGTPRSAATPMSSVAGDEVQWSPHFKLEKKAEPSTLRASQRPGRIAQPVVSRLTSFGKTLPLEAIAASPPPSPPEGEPSTHPLRRRSTELLRALSHRAQAALDAVPRSTAQLHNRVRRRPSDMSLEALGDAPPAQRPLLQPSRSFELLARLNPLQLFQSPAASNDSLATMLTLPGGFTQSAKAFGAVTQLNRLLRIDKADAQLLPAFVTTVRVSRPGYAARTPALRTALRHDAALQDAADRGLLALYDELFVPRIRAHDEDTLERLDVREQHKKTLWLRDHGPSVEVRAANLLPRMELLTCKVGLERMLSALIFLLEPPGGTEVMSRIDLGQPEPLSVQDWQTLLAPWSAFVTPEEIEGTHRMGLRRDS